MLPLNDWKGLLQVAPFLSNNTLNALVENVDPEKDMSHIFSLAPFLEEETLDRFLQKLPADTYADISGLFPFLSQKTLKRMAETLMRGGNLQALKSIALFL